VFPGADLDVQGEPLAIERDDPLDGLFALRHQIHEFELRDVFVVQVLHFEADFVLDLHLGQIADEHDPVLGLGGLNGYFRHGALPFLVVVMSFI
jgi:hypothetical protein